MSHAAGIPLETLNMKVSIGPFLFDLLLDKGFTALGQPMLLSFAHSHPAFEMHFITSGSGYCAVGGSDIALQAGDAILIPPGIFHRFHSKEPLSKGYLQFTFTVKETSDELFPETETADIMKALASLQGATVLQSFHALHWIGSIQEELKENRFGCYAKVQGLFMQLLIDVLRIASAPPDSRSKPRIPLKTKDDSRTRTIDLFFERMLHEQLKIEQLAEELYLSVKQTQRIVRQLYGKPFKQIATESQMALAKQLLSAGSTSVQAIAERLGYADPKHFSRRFIQEQGMSPQQYRKLYQQARQAGTAPLPASTSAIMSELPKFESVDDPI